MVISLQRLGVEVHAADRYADAPAMQVAHFSYALNMADAAELKQLIQKFSRISLFLKLKRLRQKYWLKSKNRILQL